MKFSKYFFFVTLLLLPSLVFAGSLIYQPLQRIKMPDGSELYNNDILSYLKNIYTFAIAIAGALAVVKIVYAGIKYMMSDAFTTKADSIKEIKAAFAGLFMALGSYVFLYTLNPNLVKFSLNIGATKQIGADATGFFVTNMNGDVIPGGVGGAGPRPTGTIAQQSINGVVFPPTSGLTNDQVLQMINNSGILDVPPPSDASQYFPGGVPTAQGYLNLLASIANSESGFNPNDGINHKQGYDVGSTYSEGLFSLTPTDSIVQQLGYGSDEALANPANNTQAAIQILKNQIRTTGSVAGSAGNHYWGPLYRGE